MKRSSVMPVDFDWSDLGASDAVWSASERDDRSVAVQGTAIVAALSDTLIRAAPGMMIVAVGVRNVAIIGEPDAVLVVDLAHAQEVLGVVELLKARRDPRIEFPFSPATPPLADLAAAAWLDGWMRNALPLWCTLGQDGEGGGALTVEAGTRGVDPGRGLAMDALYANFLPRSRRARLWPQTERLKAALILAEGFAEEDRPPRLADALRRRGRWRAISIRPRRAYGATSCSQTTCSSKSRRRQARCIIWQVHGRNWGIALEPGTDRSRPARRFSFGDQ